MTGQDRQRTDSIGRTVLQTAAQKRSLEEVVNFVSILLQICFIIHVPKVTKQCSKTNLQLKENGAFFHNKIKPPQKTELHTSYNCNMYTMYQHQFQQLKA